MWFQKWFDTPYYHLLYKNRDEQEAGFFIDNLIANLNTPLNAKIWDNACGAGRHSFYLAQKGFLSVIGTDIGESNIITAKKQNKLPNASFYTHDMRREFYVNYFDLALNLFTSFGYFDYEYESRKALRVMAHALKKKGFLAIDYLNPEYVKAHLKEREERTEGSIRFLIEKKITDDKVVKKITVNDGAVQSEYEETVNLYNLLFFEKELKAVNLQLINSYGDYTLQMPIEETSPRQIMIFQKR